MAVLVPPRRKLCVHSRPKTIHILQCHFIRSHIRRVQVCVAAVTCHLQLDRMIVCLINLTSRPYVTQSLRQVHVSHHHYVTLTSRSCISSSLRHPYVTFMYLIILTLRPCVSSSLRYAHVSHHPYVTFMCPIILTSRSCVPSS